MILLLILIPTAFCMLTWVVVTAGRLLFPERPLPFDRDRLQAWPPQASLEVPVAARDIRQDQQRRRQVRTYQYLGGDSEGLPAAWHDELWLRRN